MNKLKMRCMKNDASDSTLQGFFPAILSVTDNRVADGCKLRPDLILQSRHQRNPDQRGGAKRPLDRILEFSTGRPRVTRCGQLLKHSFSSKVVNQRPFFRTEMPTNYCKILPYRSMTKKLSNECISIGLGFCKEQNPGREAIYAMDNKSPLSLRFQFCGKKRQGGRCIGAFDRHSQKAGGFIERQDGIIFVEDGMFR